MEVTKKMTSGNDIVLKSWLRTLRYSIEYYEDTFDSKNNRRSENNQRAKNMVIGGDSSDDSEDGQYVNVWDCSDRGEGVSKLKNSLESVGNTSEVSNFGSENTSLHTVSGTDLSSGSYCLEEIESVRENFGESLQTTDLDDKVVVKRTKKKPVAAPRLSKCSDTSEAIYVNLPLITRNSRDSVFIEESTENRNLRTQHFSETSHIYENLPLIPRNSKESIFTSNDSLKFEEEVSSTIQYLEDVIESVDTCSDDSDSENIETSKIPTDKCSFDSNCSTISSNFDEDICLSPQTINDKKFTESTSSFEEYLGTDESHCEDNDADSLNQRFAKDNRISVFFEEQEPGPPQEVKNIPIPKNKSTRFDCSKRFSVPLRFTEQTENIQRPQSLGNKIVNLNSHSIFEILALDIEENNKTKLVEETAHSEDSAKEELESFDTFETSLREKVNSSAEHLNLSFAKESRISSVFEEGIVEELLLPESVSENSVLQEKFIGSLREHVVFWMSSLLECCGELDNIMEEKELLKSINQVPKDRTERPIENKFPLDDDVEVRRNPRIRTNRISKTTDFDVGRKKQPSHVNPKNFEIRGMVKIELASRTILTKLKEEYIAYENENFYRINEKTKCKELLAPNVIIKSIRYPKSKESKEVEMTVNKNVTYLLHFQELKYAKQFMENEKIQVYIIDNKVTIKKTLLRFLGKRSSREILEKKGIYKNEPIFGNTLRDIYIKSGTNSLVPAFIYEVIRLLEKPENITSLGVYRTSGNLATIQKIRFEVDNGRLNILGQYAKDPDVLTGSLKLFFRELKEPLISREICDKLLDFTKLDPKQISSKERQKIKAILDKSLHEANLETFVVIMRHLLEVIKYKEQNKMDAYNMAVCWGPSMIFSPCPADVNAIMDLSKDLVTQSHDATRLVDYLLGYYELHPAELATLGKGQRLENIPVHSLKRQESKDSVGSFDSSKSQRKSTSCLSLSIDEITKRLVDLIEQHILCEGLYRKSGSADKTNKIMKKLNKKKINELEKYKNDVHDLTDALKKHLKEQDCLVNEDTIELVLRASPDSSQSCLEPATRRKVISLIEDTPKKDTLIFLLRHLARVLDYQEGTYNVAKNDIINVWTGVLHNQKKSKWLDEDFAKFLAISVNVFNDNLPDIVRSSFNNNGSSPNRNESMDELMKEMKHQQAERDRNSRYDNVDSDAGEASILDDKTEQTKL